MSIPYGLSAKYYDDAYAVKPDLVDLPFYVDLAKQIGGPILEMGCGTGRVLLPGGALDLLNGGASPTTPRALV